MSTGLSLEKIVSAAEAGVSTVHNHTLARLHAKVAAQVEAICASGTKVTIEGLNGATMEDKLAALDKIAAQPREDAIQALQKLHSMLPR